MKIEMKDQDDEFISDLYSMILSGLIALHMELNIGKVRSSTTSETLYLGKWLKRIKKQKLFPKTISKEIDNFLAIYAEKGVQAELGSLFRKVYNEFSSFS